MNLVKYYPRNCIMTLFATLISLYFTTASASPAPFETEEEPDLFGRAKTNSRSDFFKRNSLAISTGSYAMHELDQTMDKVVGETCALWIVVCLITKDVTEPLTLKFDSTPGTALGIEYERYMEGNWSLGFEYNRVTHAFTAASLTPTRGELELTRKFFIMKKYFSTGTPLEPYIGIGGGFIGARMSGAITSSADESGAAWSVMGSNGTGWSGMAGVVYKLSDITLRAGYRYSESDIEISDAYSNDGSKRKTYGSLSTDSSGYFAGIELRF
jgi:hypothetical protein